MSKEALVIEVLRLINSREEGRSYSVSIDDIQKLEEKHLELLKENLLNPDFQTVAWMYLKFIDRDKGREARTIPGHLLYECTTINDLIKNYGAEFLKIFEVFVQYAIIKGNNGNSHLIVDSKGRIRTNRIIDPLSKNTHDDIFEPIEGKENISIRNLLIKAARYTGEKDLIAFGIDLETANALNNSSIEKRAGKLSKALIAKEVSEKDRKVIISILNSNNPRQELTTSLLIWGDKLASFIKRKYGEQDDPVQAFLDSFQPMLAENHPLKLYQSPNNQIETQFYDEFRAIHLPICERNEMVAFNLFKKFILNCDYSHPSLLYASLLIETNQNIPPDKLLSLSYSACYTSYEGFRNTAVYLKLLLLKEVSLGDINTARLEKLGGYFIRDEMSLSDIQSSEKEFEAKRNELVLKNNDIDGWKDGYKPDSEFLREVIENSKMIRFLRAVNCKTLNEALFCETSPNRSRLQKILKSPELMDSLKDIKQKDNIFTLADFLDTIQTDKKAAFKFINELNLDVTKNPNAIREIVENANTRYFLQAASKAGVTISDIFEDTDESAKLRENLKQFAVTCGNILPHIPFDISLFDDSGSSEMIRGRLLDISINPDKEAFIIANGKNFKGNDAYSFLFWLDREYDAQQTKLLLESVDETLALMQVKVPTFFKDNKVEGKKGLLSNLEDTLAARKEKLSTKKLVLDHKKLLIQGTRELITASYNQKEHEIKLLKTELEIARNNETQELKAMLKPPETIINQGVTLHNQVGLNPQLSP